MHIAKFQIHFELRVQRVAGHRNRRIELHLKLARQRLPAGGQPDRVLAGQHQRTAGREAEATAAFVRRRAADMRALIAEVPHDAIETGVLRHAAEIADHFTGRVEHFDFGRAAINDAPRVA